MDYFKKQKASKYSRGAEGSPSGAKFAKEQPGSDPRPEQSPGEQDPQQATPSPSTTGRTSRLFGRFSGWRSRSPSRSRSGAEHNPTNQPTATSKSQLLAVPAERPHTSHSETSTQETHKPSGAQGSSLAHSRSKSIPSENPTQNIVQVLPRIDVHTTVLPQTVSAQRPDITGPSPHSSSAVWTKALEIAQQNLSKHNLPPLDLKKLTSQSAGENTGAMKENIMAVVKALETLEKDNRKKGWSYTWRGKEVIVVERFGEILKCVANYSKVVDTAIQSNPQVSALVWAGIRAIMQVALNHVEVIEGLEVAIAKLLQKMTICEFYARIYCGVALQSIEDEPQLQRILNCALPEIYAAVIVFAVKARDYFEAGSRKKFAITFKSFEIEFQPFIEEINVKEAVVRECASAATMQRIRSIDSSLRDITSELEPIARLNDDRIRKLLKLLTPLEPLKRHQDVKFPRSENAGSWLMQLESFSKWQDSNFIEENGHIFCCFGIPGAGKTVISSVVIDNLNSRFHSNLQIGVAFLYADYKDQTNQTLGNILGSFLHQLLTTARMPIPDEVIQKLEDIRYRRGKVGTEDNLDLLKIQLHQLQCAFICIDAIDELEPKVRRQLLNVLKELGTYNTRLFFTGRHHIESEVKRSFQVVKKNKVEISASHQDIESFVRQQIVEDPNSDMMDERLVKEIVGAIVKKSQGMFLLPTLHIKMVLEMLTDSQRRNALNSLPTDLHDSFQDIISRIRTKSKAGVGMQVLMWLHFAYKPLKMAELQHALAVERYQAEFDRDNIYSPKVLLDCCLGLVLLDEETLTVRFMHYTLEEYFCKYSKEEFPNGYSYIAETCLTYLNFGELRQHCMNLDSLREKITKYALLNYAALYWGAYVKEQCDDGLTNLANIILDHESEHPPCAIQVLYLELLDKNNLSSDQPHVQRFSGVHVAAYFGLSGNMAYLCELKRHIELKDESGRTPLSWAAEYGHESIARMLIEQAEVDINSQDDKYKKTPLCWAAEAGNESVVQLLIQSHDIGINTKDHHGQTPLILAVQKGHEGVVQLLIKRGDVDVNSKDDYGQTPLMFAAADGREAVVKLLIQRDDIDINPIDKNRRTPLLSAIRERHKAVVQLLVNRDDIDINMKGDRGRTPLSWAAALGWTAIVRLLIEKDGVDINAKDEHGNAPLSLAATYQCVSLLELLVKRADIDINVGNNWGQTPLMFAVYRDNEAAARLLIEGGNADINAKDKYGMTPLLWAAARGSKAIVQLLLEKDGIDVNAEDNQGRTPFICAAQGGFEAVLRLLMGRGDIDINVKDEDEMTALMWATMRKHETVVQLLTERGDVGISGNDEDRRTSPPVMSDHKAVLQLLPEGGDLDITGSAKDNYGQIPLIWAAARGQEGVVRLLLERDKIDINAKDKGGRTALMWAASKGHEAIVLLLIGRDDVDIDSKDKNGRTPLILAAKWGFEAVVELLIEKNGVDMNIQDNYGETPLTWAAQNGHEAVVQLLVKRVGVDINAVGKYEATSLILAAKKGHEGVVRLLLDQRDVDIDARDKDGETSLLWATNEGHEAVVRLLLEKGIDINATNNNGRTPFTLAAICGHEAVVRLLLERDNVDINAKDNEGWTPLKSATSKGHEAVVRLLLGRDNVDINAKDNKGSTPLQSAASKGYEAVVRLLLERDNININAKDNDGRTSLIYAAANGHEAVVRLLLERDNIDINAKDNEGWTPLKAAASKGNEAVVRLLLERDNVDINAKNNKGWTPLKSAASKGNEAVVRLLVERDNIDINAKDNKGWTPLKSAAAHGHEAVVQLLLERSDININAKDNEGWTPLKSAASKGYEAVVRLLLERDNVDINSKDNEGWIPLMSAAGNGHEAVVRLLLEKDNIDINAKDNEGWTPLISAAANGCEAVVWLLLERDVDTKAKDNDGYTSLMWATEKEHEAVVRLLMERDNEGISA